MAIVVTKPDVLLVGQYLSDIYHSLWVTSISQIKLFEKFSIWKYLCESWKKIA